jgi:hypothetical protein
MELEEVEMVDKDELNPGQLYEDWLRGDGFVLAS